MRRLGLNNEIFLMDVETLTLRQMTYNSGLVMTNLLWSPDSQHFLGVPADASNRAMYMLNSFSGQREGFDRSSAYGNSPQWSPDGQQIAFILGEDQGQATVAVSRGENTDIFIADSAGEHIRSVSQPGRTELAPAWSPDNRHLAFVSIAPNDTQIYLTDLGESQPRPITFSPGEKWGLAWSPLGDSLAFIALRGQQAELYQLDLATGIERQITHNTVWEWRVTWSPDGHYLLYEANPRGYFSLYLVELATLTERELSARGAATNHWSVWKPN
jgi:Tol biopolymer transport system component